MTEGEGGRKLAIVVGVFVMVALAVGLGVVFLLGQKRHVFEPRVTLHAGFTDVSGLRPGAPVWLSGVGVGSVTRVIVGGPGERRVTVDLEITREMLSRVRADSVASIGSQGLLGDKIVQISMGSAISPMLSEGAWIAAATPADFNKLVEQAGDILVNVQKVAKDAAEISRELAQPRTVGDFRRAMAAARGLLEQVERGPGLAHALFYDRDTADSVDRLVHDVQHVAAAVAHGVVRIDQVLDATDADGRQLLNHVARAARSVGEVADGVQRSHALANLDRATADLAAMTGRVRAGQGTIGALIADPMVYEQLVTVLGGVQRSRVLRALVRYAISRDNGRSASKAIEAPEEARPPARPPSHDEARR